MVDTPLPAVIAAQKGLNEPRYASLPGIMKAKKKPIDKLDLAAVGFGADEVGAAGAKVKLSDYTLPPERAAGKVLEGEVEEITPEVVRLLREEAKVI